MLCFVEREHNVFPGCAKDTWGKIAGEAALGTRGQSEKKLWMGGKVVIMKTSACLVPKLLGSPGTGSSLLHMCFCPDVPWSRWSETGGCLGARVDSGPCGGWPCCNVLQICMQHGGGCRF